MSADTVAVREFPEFSSNQRKDKERQEEEETEEPKRFTVQEMARGFSLFEGALLVFEAEDSNVERYYEGCSSRSECNPVLLFHL